MFNPAYDLVTRAIITMRKEAGLTQRQLAERLGRELSFVSRIEQGQRRLDMLEWIWVCRACDVDPIVQGARVLEAMATVDRRQLRR